jgi:protease-4
MDHENQRERAHSIQKPKRNRSGCWIALVIAGVLAISFFAFIFLFIVMIGSSFTSKPPSVAANSVLELKLPAELQEQATSNPFAIFMEGQKPLTYMQTLSALKRAKEDPNIEGIYLNPMHFQADITKTLEIYRLLEEFKEHGKFVYAFIEFGNEWDYLLATVADSIFMPPESIIELNGFAILDIFWKGTYEKLGIDYYVEQYEEYKAAGETVSRTGFSRPARESLDDLLNHRLSTWLKTVAKARSLEERNLDSALRKGIYQPEDMWSLGLIDAIEPHWKVEDKLKRTAKGSKLRLTPLAKYAASKSGLKKSGYRDDIEIAMVVVSGIMLTGDTGDIAPFENAVCGSKSFARHLDKARKNDKVKAIIIRIDSPGGSIMAADEMWSEINRTRQQMPVFASMSSVAASGGYYIATACDTIIAHPTTVTGSIGVVSMIPNFSKTLDKIDASIDTLKTHDSALFLNPFLPFGYQDKAYFSKMSKSAYYRFVEKVAQSRNLTFQQARELAKGRIWIGDQAFQKGLVDTLGNLQSSIEIVKNRLGIDKTEKVRIRIYPEPEDNLTAFLKLFSAQAIANRRVNPIGENEQNLLKALPALAQESIQYQMQLQYLARQEHILMVMPSLPDIH